MESERYCFTYGHIRSDWLYRSADDAYDAAVAHQEDWTGMKGKEITIWVKTIERVDF